MEDAIIEKKREGGLRVEDPGRDKQRRKPEGNGSGSKQKKTTGAVAARR